MLQLSRRETKETCIDVVLETEGSGRIDVETEIELLDMILTSLGKGAHFDLILLPATTTPLRTQESPWERRSLRR